MTDSPVSRWKSLGTGGSRRTDGSKARVLAHLLHAGVPVAPGWTLPIDVTARLDAAGTPTVAAELLALDPGVHAWILRSSSPWEDRPHHSGAGLLASERAEATPESVVRALNSVLYSGKKLNVEVAVLAQAFLTLDTWATAEIAPDQGWARLEGWRREAGDARLWHRETTWPLDEALEPEIRGLLETAGLALAWTASNEARAFYAGHTITSWLLELGTLGDQSFVLQLRPAPKSAPPLMGSATPAHDDHFPLFPEDENVSWIWDAEHSPTALCPLLAGWFQRWLRRGDARQPSRLIHGRWHDRPARARAVDVPPWEVPAALAQAADQWRRDEQPRLVAQIESLEQEASELTATPGAWTDFMEGWLTLQRHYYARNVSTRRVWAVAVQQALIRDHPHLPPPPLPVTDAQERSDRLDALGHSCAREAAPSEPETLLQWFQQLPAHHDVARALSALLERHGHVCAHAWDGRGVTWKENPRPLMVEIVARMGSTSEASSTPEAYARELAAAAPVEVSVAWEHASRLLAQLEDDDALLMRAYAAFRYGARRLARRLGLSPRAEDEVFDLMPDDLEHALRQRSISAWRRGVARGRALAALWSTPPVEFEAPGTTGDWRQGHAASTGRAEGPVRRLDSATSDGGPRPGDVVVVPTLLPADAAVLSRAAAIVTESGGTLSHAAVLTRERGIPCVVAVEGARRWLAAAQRVLVDGDSGTVTILAGQKH